MVWCEHSVVNATIVSINVNWIFKPTTKFLYVYSNAGFIFEIVVWFLSACFFKRHGIYTPISFFVIGKSFSKIRGLRPISLLSWSKRMGGRTAGPFSERARAPPSGINYLSSVWKKLVSWRCFTQKFSFVLRVHRSANQNCAQKH